MSSCSLHCRHATARPSPKPARCIIATLLAGLGLTLALVAPAHASAPAKDYGPAPAVPSGAVAEGAFDGVTNRVEARLLVDVEQVRAGETFRVGVLFDLDPGWHIYWRSPGNSGLPTELHWQVDPGQLEVGDIQWPTPGTFDEAEGLIITYGYSGRVLLHANARVSETATEPIQLSVEAHFLVCEIACIPGAIQLSRELAVVPSNAALTSAAEEHVVALFDDAAAAKPLALTHYGLGATALYSQSAVRPGDRFEAAISLGCQGRAKCTPPISGEEILGYSFIPDLMEGIQLEVTATRPHPLSPGDLLIELSGEAGAGASTSEQQLSGIASLVMPDGRAVAAELALPLPRATAGSEVAAIGTPWRTESSVANASAVSTTSVSLWQALLFALLGGLILNLMPCVLPVLAIKVFAIAELAHTERRAVLANGAAYAAGIVSSMLVLAASVIALRAGGEAVGWGFQFQEPVFVAAICAVLVAFALNLFGVFEIFAPTGSLGDLGASASGTKRSFFEGLLAVVLATPCSAPFLGTAVGFAFAGTPTSIVAIFVAIGIGLASPFVAVTWIPSLARFVPRSGPWMITLRSGLGFAVLATVVWLLWVVGRLVGSDGVAALLAFLVATAFAAWVFGLLQARGRATLARGVAVVSIAAAVIGLSALPLEPVSSAADHKPTYANGATSFSKAAVANELSQGHPVFVYFTADWCITCKVNEKTTLADADVRSALDNLDFKVFRADWTQRNASITEELARFGKAGVPLYLVYDPGMPEAPILLPELLTPGILIKALQAAARS
ncbi:MAG: thioredoxin family protein [Myxococcota bacterium]|nr:thioredoxin family protein [Myxococcota bacterium]